MSTRASYRGASGRLAVTTSTPHSCHIFFGNAGTVVRESGHETAPTRSAALRAPRAHPVERRRPFRSRARRPVRQERVRRPLHHGPPRARARRGCRGRRWRSPPDSHGWYLEAIETEAARGRLLYDLLVIPGLELTYEDHDPCRAAHAVAVGLRRLVDLEAGLDGALESARGAGAALIGAHPYRPEQAKRIAPLDLPLGRRARGVREARRPLRALQPPRAVRLGRRGAAARRGHRRLPRARAPAHVEDAAAVRQGGGGGGRVPPLAASGLLRPPLPFRWASGGGLTVSPSQQRPSSSFPSWPSRRSGRRPRPEPRAWSTSIRRRSQVEGLRSCWRRRRPRSRGGRRSAPAGRPSPSGRRSAATGPDRSRTACSPAASAMRSASSCSPGRPGRARAGCAEASAPGSTPVAGSCSRRCSSAPPRAASCRAGCCSRRWPGSSPSVSPRCSHGDEVASGSARSPAAPRRSRPPRSDGSPSCSPCGLERPSISCTRSRSRAR